MIICISQAVFLAEVINYSVSNTHMLFMINRENSVFCNHLASALHLWAMRSSYWLSVSPTLHFVSVSGSLRDRRARQSYKVKYLGLALALQVSVIILLEAFLLCWIIMEVRVYACHLSSVGGGSQREAQDREMFAFLLCHPRSTRVRQTRIVPRAQSKLHSSTDFLLLNMWHTKWNLLSCGWDNERCSPKAIICFEIKCNYQCQACVFLINKSAETHICV